MSVHAKAKLAAKRTSKMADIGALTISVAGTPDKTIAAAPTALTLPAGTADTTIAAPAAALTLPTGTADATIAEPPALGAAPADAAALATDLNTNVLPVIAANTLDLGTRVNALATLLEANSLDLGTQINALATQSSQNERDLAAQINAIRTALRANGLML